MNLRWISLFALLVPSEAWIVVAPARIPNDLPKIRDCRSTAIEGSQAVLQSVRHFVNAEAAAKQSVVCVVAKERLPPSRVIGTADIKVKGSSALIKNVFVRTDRRGKGIGRRLLTEVERMLEPGTELKLIVKTTNTPAVSLYTSLGFEATGVHSVTAKVSQLTGAPLQVTMSKIIE